MRNILVILSSMLLFTGCGGFRPAQYGDLGQATNGSSSGGQIPTPSSSGNTANLSWTPAAAGGQTGFVIQESTDGTNYTAIQTLAGTVTSATVPGLMPGTTYYFRIMATNSAGDSMYTQGSTSVTP